MSRALSREQIVRLIEGVNLAGSREEAEALIRKANNKGDCSDGDAASAERSRWLQEAYRDEGSDDVPGGWGIAHDAKLYRGMRLHQLFMAVHRMAARMDQVDPPKRKRGGRGGTLSRWGMANYWAAAFVERRMDEWCREHCTKRVPDSIKEKLVEDEIKRMELWDKTERGRWPDEKPLDKDRIIDLLLEARSRRLSFRSAAK
jgi:hypothetical protein